MTQAVRRSYAVLVFRLALGVLFIAHALAKIFIYTIPGTMAFFEDVGIPGALAVPVILVELLSGLLLVLGLHTRWAALALVPVMIGATTVHWPNGWIFSNPNGGWEFTVFLALACVGLFLLADDGAFSLSSRLDVPQRRSVVEA